MNGGGAYSASQGQAMVSNLLARHHKKYELCITLIVHQHKNSMANQKRNKTA